MSSTPSVSLWVKAEPFTYGALQVAPHPRLSPHSIKKIVPYAKTKGSQGYPKLSYSVWRHIACNKLQLSEDLAWMYFETYTLISDVAPEQRIKWDQDLSRCETREQREVIRNQMAVHTLKFVLLLYIQQLHKISLRTSMVFSEEWPTRARSPDLEGRATPTSSKALDEHGHILFMLTHLNEIMELVEPESSGAALHDLNLSVEAVDALGFLIGGSVDRNKTMKPLKEIALLQPMQAKFGYSKITGMFSFRTFQSFLRSSIGNSPFGITQCIASGRRLSWPMAVEEKVAKSDQPTKKGKIATNAHFVPKDQLAKNKMIIMSQVCKQTIARSSGTLEKSSVKIHRCHYSYLYLLSPLRTVSIEKCRHSTIVLGAVETTIHLNSCEHVTVIAATRRITISNSTLCTFHLLSPTRPLILGGNDSVVLAPYHTFYPKLQDHMAQSGLSNITNKWDQPFCVGPDHQDDHPCWEIMDPKDFYTFNIPFEMVSEPGSTKAIPYELPTKYKKAVTVREKQIDVWQKMVKEAGLSREQRKQFQQLVETRFQDWLVESGHKREIDALVLPQETKEKK